MSIFDNHIIKCYYFVNNLYYHKKKTLLNKILIITVSRYYSFLLKFLYGSFIPFEAKLGKNIKFIHSFHGIFISQYSTIGDNCKILHHVTIGSNIQSEGGIEAPLIKNNVFIGCNSNIIGKTIIEDNCKIGAGVTITNKIIQKNSIVYSDNIVIKENKKI
jgi:serine O-acetyltransferase